MLEKFPRNRNTSRDRGLIAQNNMRLAAGSEIVLRGETAAGHRPAVRFAPDGAMAIIPVGATCRAEAQRSRTCSQRLPASELHRFELLTELEDGVEGKETCLRLNPDLVVMDICLPRTDGIELAGFLIKRLSEKMPWRPGNKVRRHFHQPKKRHWAGHQHRFPLRIRIGAVLAKVPE